MIEDIKKYIPQRDPMLHVDRLLSVDGNIATTAFTVRPENILVEAGLLTEAGLIEHIAQSESALAGYQAVAEGAQEPPVGMIGEVKDFHCYRRPAIGERLSTTITMGPEVNGITLVMGKTMSGEEVVADTKMKISI